MSNPVVSAEELASHLVCPQQREFAHESPLSPRESHPTVRRQVRRELLAETVRRGLTAEAAGPDDRVDAALAMLNSTWGETAGSYLTARQERFDRDAIEAAVTDYFHGIGERHAAGLVETDVVLSCPMDDVTYEVAVDAVAKLNNTYTAIRYVPDLTGVHPAWKDDPVAEYLSGEGFWPEQIGHIGRAAIAMKGLMAEYGLEHSQDFAYVSLLSNVEREYGTDREVTATATARHFGTAYENEAPEIRRLLETRGSEIVADGTDISETDLDRILDHSCRDCPYQDGCPEFLESELSFSRRRSRRQAGTGGPGDHPPTHPSGEPATQPPTRSSDDPVTQSSTQSSEDPSSHASQSKEGRE